MDSRPIAIAGAAYVEIEARQGGPRNKPPAELRLGVGGIVYWTLLSLRRQRRAVRVQIPLGTSEITRMICSELSSMGADIRVQRHTKQQTAWRSTHHDHTERPSSCIRSVPTEGLVWNVDLLNLEECAGLILTSDGPIAGLRKNIETAHASGIPVVLVGEERILRQVSKGSICPSAYVEFGVKSEKKWRNWACSQTVPCLGLAATHKEALGWFQMGMDQSLRLPRPEAAVPEEARAGYYAGQVMEVLSPSRGSTPEALLTPDRRWSAALTQTEPELQLRAPTLVLDGYLRSLHELASLDSLTGILSRGACERAIKTLQNSGTAPLFLLLLDVDRFKVVNDRWGHATGDQVLKALTTVLKQGLRGQQLLARWGGEEFLCVFPGVDLETATRIAERLRKAVYRLKPLPDGSPVSFSGGLVRLSSGQSLAEAVACADKALYQAKTEGRNRIVRTMA